MIAETCQAQTICNHSLKSTVAKEPLCQYPSQLDFQLKNGAVTSPPPSAERGLRLGGEGVAAAGWAHGQPEQGFG